MDIIDVILAKALTPQQLAAYISQAQEATSIATEAAENIESITEQTNENNANAETALEQAQEAYELNADALARVGTAIVGSITGEIKKLVLSKVVTDTASAIVNNLRTTYPDDSALTVEEIAKYYKASGQNTDGTMTQKAITDMFTDVNNSIDTISENLTELEQSLSSLEGAVTEIQQNIDEGGSSSGGTTDLGSENAGKMVSVGEDGTIIVSNITEEALIEALIQAGNYVAQNAVGLQIDYENRTFTRVQEAIDYSMGTDFDKYSMYGGRKLCNVNDEGMITAWYGDAAYKEDGSNGQVMIYQPKFYYSRVQSKVVEIATGSAIRKETVIVTSTEQPGFKIHPLFLAADGSELDYVLLSAYEGCAYTDTYDLTDSSDIDFTSAKLSSIAGAKPISGVNKRFTLANAERMAQNRGSAWHVTNMAAESAQQMLQLIEYGTLNGQSAIETGLSYLTNDSSANCASITGSTASLGNGTGAATSTINEVKGTYTTYSEEGKRAVRYRGFENPWGNIWRMVGGVQVVGNQSQNGGILQICSDFDYTDNNKYVSIGFQLPSQYDWVSAFGVPTAAYDWVFAPIECYGGSSALPVGDNLWTTPSLNRTNMVCVGGQWYFELNNGMFYYGCDQAANTYARSFSARLMYIPVKNSIYTANIAAWRSKL